MLLRSKYRKIYMSIDKYNEITAAIFSELKEISAITEKQALANCADMSNPHFKNLMIRHARLTTLAADLNNQMLSQFGINTP